jgi:hypothetical protein
VLSRIPASGGTPSTVLDLTSELSAALWPYLLPGGTHALVTVMSLVARRRPHAARSDRERRARRLSL